MRKTSWIALAALFVAPTGLRAQQSSQKSAATQSSQSSSASQNSASPSQQEDPLVLAARKAREQRKNQPQAAKVFDNDNLPTSGGISTVGSASSPAATDKDQKNQKTQSASSNPAGKDADAWRSKFANLRQKLQQDQSELSVMQRELGQDALQYYNGDPQKAAQDQASGHPMGEAYDKKQAAIEAKQKQVDGDQQAISDAEDALRQAGGDPGWAR
ncbi:MAG: hypothetical protein ACRD4X_14640 [Candidatus Acidiferrales bacterium]